MVNYGEFYISLPDDVNEAFVDFSYESDYRLTATDLIHILMFYGLEHLGYYKVPDCFTWKKQEECEDL